MFGIVRICKYILLIIRARQYSLLTPHVLAWPLFLLHLWWDYRMRLEELLNNHSSLRKHRRAWSYFYRQALTKNITYATKIEQCFRSWKRFIVYSSLPIV